MISFSISDNVSCFIKYFLIKKASVSHNNISEQCIFINSRHEWKLNNFELSLPFSKVNRTNLREIYEFKCKNAITPEEEHLDDLTKPMPKSDMNITLKLYPHSIDVYGWAMLMLNILSKYLSEEIQELEVYLSKDIEFRPKLQNALNMKIFDSYRNSSVENKLNLSDNHIDTKNDNETTSIIDQLKFSDCNELELNLPKLIDYLKLLHIKHDDVNEKLVDFLLSPCMFFKDKIRNEIFPSVFIPKEETTTNTTRAMNLHFYSNFTHFKKFAQDKQLHFILEPFIPMNKYKAFVLPRILNLFSMRSTQIRLVLLEYFPFFISHINDMDTLRYEILPEVNLPLNNFVYI